ncbi:MAG: esterase/lipase family protein [Gammaproteobacteria bacterium]
MNDQQRKDRPSLARLSGVIILAVFFNMAATINSPAKAADNPPSPPVACFLNWAQALYPSLFSPLVSDVQFSAPYTYRYYPDTNSYLGVSSADDHVYYLGPEDVSLRDLGDLSAWLAESGCGARPYPVIFIHGLASSADTWIPFRDYLIHSGGWTFGGIPTYNPDTKTVDISCPIDPNQLQACTGNAGDFYTLNFSDNQWLSLDNQGGELAAIIQAVLDENPEATKVLLIGHSMGGLAAREYLQGLARESDSAAAIPYREDVAKLITVGTPHQGSFWAEGCYNHLDLSDFPDFFDIPGSVGICDLLPLPLDPSSVAVEELVPNSAALNILNDLTTYPLPSNVSYVSIIGTGQSTLVSLDLTDLKDGDGVVSAISQDLLSLTGDLPLQQKSVKTDVLLRECGENINVPFVGDFGETHTCETTDIGVGAEILRNLQ